MKRVLILAVAVMVLFGLTPSAQANGPVTIGVNGGPTWLVKGANMGWIRVSPYWRFINPSPNVYNWTDVDNLLEDVNNYDLKILFILSGAPTWCGSDDNGAKPCNIAAWKTFVDELTKHIAAHPYKNRVGAFEVWNEPDLRDSATFAVGWDADYTQAPKYVDYVIEASRAIRRNLPGVKVVAGSLSGKRNDLNRLRWTFQDFENTWSYDPDLGVTKNASDYIDAISGHMNGGDDLSSDTAAYLYQYNVLNWLRDYNPRNRNKPQWVTEFGWRSADMGEDAQRRRIKNFLIEMTGGGWGYLSGWNMTHGFIYVCELDLTSRSIYYPNTFYPPHAPKKVVTQYLQTLPFPATQQPGVPVE
jgi:hypothetical protein